MSDATYAWCAGFFDGEGSISCANYGGKYKLELSVTQVQPRPLYRLSGYLGGHVVGPYVNKNPLAKRKVYRWRIAGKDAVLALRLMLPYLTVKQEQAQCVMVWPSGDWNKIPTSVLTMRDDIIANINSVKLREKANELGAQRDEGGTLVPQG